MFIYLLLLKSVLEFFLYVFHGMGSRHFQFTNKSSLRKSQRKQSDFEKRLKKFFLFSSVFVFLGFFLFKFSYFKVFKNKSLFVKEQLYSKEKVSSGSIHSLPLFVNLKGDKGPYLARIHVSLTVSESSKQELVSRGDHLEKHILFILSGQSVKDLNNQKNHFEKQIRFQINAFLSKDLVAGVHIQTQNFN